MPVSDFDYLFGRWTIRNRALCTPLHSTHDWCEFSALYECRGLGKLGNIGHFRASWGGEDLEGVGLRLYNPATDEWTLRWADTARAGAMQPPVTGRFSGASGTFVGNAFYDARPIRVRVVWTRGSHPKFEQAFSADRGRTWETNWRMSFTPWTAEARGREARVALSFRQAPDVFQHAKVNAVDDGVAP